YIKCPRCELNWILEENEYCDVCKAELGVEGFTLLEDEDEDMLCPVCGANYIEHGERMCSECKSKQKDEVGNYETESASSDDEQSNIEVISFDELEQEESEEKFDIYDDAFDDPDGFATTGDFDDKETFGDDEDEEEEEEESESVDDDFESDFNYDIDDVDTSDIDDDEEDEENYDDI
ncbi:MAG: hypothetical protein K2G37_00570, partial [Clostridia bacterium]|nr:hypothetical protein [Clostridia bacterium]